MMQPKWLPQFFTGLFLVLLCSIIVSWAAAIAGPCGDCTKSGGVCRYNNSNPLCFCPYGLAIYGWCHRTQNDTAVVTATATTTDTAKAPETITATAPNAKVTAPAPDTAKAPATATVTATANATITITPPNTKAPAPVPAPAPVTATANATITVTPPNTKAPAPDTAKAPAPATATAPAPGTAKAPAPGLAVWAVGFLLISVVLFLLVSQACCNKSKNTQNIEAMLESYGFLAPKRYKYSDLKRMTKSFREKLGQGGFGSVFKGMLQDDRLVAVKILNNSKEDGEEFINEVVSIGKTSHVNIVSLLGFCLDGRKRALVYEFLPNGSLEKYIFSDEPKVAIGWDKLYQIAIGIARGLEYLHRGCNMRIVHFDIKPHNILLDENFWPKISDFGLAKLCPQKESILSMADARGTIGYIAPEVISRSFGPVSTKSDAFSYGMMVLEMVGGRRNVKANADRTSEVYFPHWVYEHLDRDGDPQAYDVTMETEEVARKMILVGLWCVQTMPAHRPSMSGVVEMLEGRISEMEMPPKPYPSSP